MTREQLEMVAKVERSIRHRSRKGSPIRKWADMLKEALSTPAEPPRLSEADRQSTHFRPGTGPSEPLTPAEPLASYRCVLCGSPTENEPHYCDNCKPPTPPSADLERANTVLRRADIIMARAETTHCPTFRECIKQELAAEFPRIRQEAAKAVYEKVLQIGADNEDAGLVAWCNECIQALDVKEE